MKIEFFGTSDGTPTASRYCSSLVIECDGARYLFDVGAPVADLFLRKGYPLSSLRAVFLTHLHSDHFNGLFHLFDVSNRVFRDASYTVFLPEQSAIDLVHQYQKVCNNGSPFREGLALKQYEAGVVFEDRRVRVTAVLVEHETFFKTYGFLVEGDGQRVYITGDMHEDLHDFPAFLYGMHLDVMVTELAHQTAPIMLSHLEKCHADRIYITHLYPQEKAAELISLADEDLKKRITVAKDNDIVVI